ncbi:hypothetical protein B0H13DRAFT_856854 [Mycena leptocephala]|nr:hypothetical protein B0H13DRAFT_856854 [Mycena leptocephala]
MLTGPLFRCPGRLTRERARQFPAVLTRQFNLQAFRTRHTAAPTQQVFGRRVQYTQDLAIDGVLLRCPGFDSPHPPTALIIIIILAQGVVFLRNATFILHPFHRGAGEIQVSWFERQVNLASTSNVERGVRWGYTFSRLVAREYPRSIWVRLWFLDLPVPFYFTLP